MFKNLTIFRIANVTNLEAHEIDKVLANNKFLPCGPTDMLSTGWGEPRGFEHGPLIESVGGQWILRLITEKKSVPASVVQRVVQERMDEIEDKEGRKPGKKEKREIKESVVLEMLPHAFAKRGVTDVWIDPSNGLLYIDSTSNSVTDKVVTMLVQVIEGIQVTPINTTTSPAAAMAQWLLEREISAEFDFAGECELLASDESKSCVKYARHRLDIEEISDHIKQGKAPRALGVSWADRVVFVLNSAMQLKKIKMIAEGSEEQVAQNDEDPFDANVALVTAELSELIPELIELLGGEMPVSNP